MAHSFAYSRHSALAYRPCPINTGSTQAPAPETIVLNCPAAHLARVLPMFMNIENAKIITQKRESIQHHQELVKYAVDHAVHLYIYKCVCLVFITISAKQTRGTCQSHTARRASRACRNPRRSGTAPLRMTARATSSARGTSRRRRCLDLPCTCWPRMPCRCLRRPRAPGSS